MELITDLTQFTSRVDEINVDKNKRELKKAIKQVTKYLIENNVAALTAPQLGFKYRFFCINFNGDVRTFINPIIAKSEGLHLTRESNPSIPGKVYIIPRADKVIGMYQTPTGLSESNRFEGFASELFEACVQLLDGVIVSDLGLEIDEDFDNATDAEQEEILSLYVETLKTYSSELADEIQNTPDLKKIHDAIKFMDALRKGEVEFEQGSPTPNTKAQNKAMMMDFLRSKK